MVSCKRIHCSIVGFVTVDFKLISRCRAVAYNVYIVKLSIILKLPTQLVKKKKSLQEIQQNSSPSPIYIFLKSFFNIFFIEVLYQVTHIIVLSKKVFQVVSDVKLYVT